MRYKATFALGLGVGYLLGSKAGRARYEELMSKYREFVGKPEVRDTAQRVQSELIDLAGTAKEKVAAKVARKHGDDADTSTWGGTGTSGSTDSDLSAAGMGAGTGGSFGTSDGDGLTGGTTGRTTGPTSGMPTV